MTKLTAQLREWRLSDAQSLAHNANDIEIWNNIRDAFPHPYSIGDAEKFIRYCLKKTRKTNWAIDVGGKAVGGVGIVPQIDIHRHSAEVGFWLGKEYWGKGITSKLLGELVKTLFLEGEITHLYAGVFEHNRASMRVMEKAGFRFVGVMKGAAIKNGKRINLHYYDISKQ